MPPSPTTDNKPTPTTPRRASATRKTSATQNVTPIRKASAQKNGNGTPKSAPAVGRKNTGSGKKVEPPSLFQDFLLGRPSPQRRVGSKGNGGSGARRRSLDVVKKEMKLGVEEVAKVQAPGGVKDRVKQWQKEIVVEKDESKKAEDAEEDCDCAHLEKGKDEGSDCECGKENEKVEKKEDGVRIRDSQKRPGRRKSKEAEDAAVKAWGDSKERSKSAAAPKKRVISDDHWLKMVAGVKPLNGPMKTSPAKKSPEESPGKGRPIPKDFLTNIRTAVNPPLERKIGDWVKRTAHEEPEPLPDDLLEEMPRDKPRSRKVSRLATPEDTPRKRKVSRQEPDNEADIKDTPPRRKPSKQEPPDDGIRIKPSPDPSDDGTRIRPSPDPVDDGIRVKPSRDNSFTTGDDSIRIKPIRKERQPKEENRSEFRTPRRRSEKHLRPPEPESSYDMESQHDNNDEDTMSWDTPTRKESIRRPRKSSSPTEDSVSEVPFGNSAFSVLELPLGAEAGTLRRPMPKRNPSFAVPKVLKKVYNEGMKIVHDTVDPPRVGVNQPPSIESWLNGTTDPFVDRPSTTPESTLNVPEPPSRMRSYKEDDRTERDLMENSDGERRRRRRAQSSVDPDNNRQGSDGVDSPLTKARETLPSMENSPPLSPTSLRRTPATRNTSSPKSARKVPLKEALLDAFRGESTTYRSKGNPLADISGLRDNRNPSGFESERDRPPARDESSKDAPPVPRHTSFEKRTDESNKPLPSFPRRQAPITGEHRLSTIASVETFSTNSSVTETTSELSQTTITQDTVLTGPTESSLSQNSNKSGLKRRLTKHSDLLSVLSLPDSPPPGRAKSIRSARSVRTNRSHLETATIPDLMRELAEDERKYIRELKTLVDGVIPVLLTCVLSKSDSAIAAGLFIPNTQGADTSFTKPIVDMGVALERMKSLHTRIPLNDTNSLLAWFQQAHKTYDDYLTAWRMGFQDVVVNLAPASNNSDSKSDMDELPRNAHGDVVNSNGERVDVAYLLKRPLVRVKYLAKILKGLDKNQPSDFTRTVMQSWADLEAKGRRRTKEEQARMVDNAANRTDTSRARDLQTLALAENVKIDQTRQVCAKDSFSLDMAHSNGQRLECQVELLLRDKPSDLKDPGDVLVCAFDVDHKWLMFPPIETNLISARLDDTTGEVVVLVRGPKWEEVMLLKSDDLEAATEWVDMLGSVPMPPPVIRDGSSLISKASVARPSVTKAKQSDIEVPIGERRRREAEEMESARKKQQEFGREQGKTTVLGGGEESVISGPMPKDLNEAMNKAGGKQFTATKHARARYHGRGDHSQSPTSRSYLSTLPESRTASYDCVYESKKARVSGRKYEMSGGLAFEQEDLSTPTSPEITTPLKESMSSEPNVLKKQRPTTPARDDGAPPPPAHRVPTTPLSLRTPPILDSPTPKAINRRTSSPLKHEYQPSLASDTSPTQSSDSEEGSFSESSDEDELELVELPEVLTSGVYPTKVSPPGSIYSRPNSTIYPSASASQAPYRTMNGPQAPAHSKKLVATITYWNGSRWEALHPEPCSIVVTAGRIEAFEMSAAHSSPHLFGPSGASETAQDDADKPRPLIAQDLTPLVNLRQSTGIDVEICSPVKAEALLKCSGTIRYRAITEFGCKQIYENVHWARMNNAYFKKLEQDRILQNYGQPYEAAVNTRRASWFGRKRSYRASTRAPSGTADDEQSTQSATSSIAKRLRRLSGSNIFNLDKSSITTPANPASQYTSSSNSMYSGPTPPHTPSSPSIASNQTSQANLQNRGSENLKIRILRYESGGRWFDHGDARLTVTAPPPGMRQRSSLHNGIERRIIVRLKPSKKDTEGPVILDEVLGAGCFNMVGSRGVVVNVWEDIVGDDGVVGRIGRVGGVSGRQKKWMFQMGNLGEMRWIYSLCASGR